MMSSILNMLMVVVSVCFAPMLMGQLPASEKTNINVDQNQFREVAGDLRCPTCTGLSVLDSDAPFSVQIKNEVKEQLAAGKTHDDVLKYFVARYGPWILRAPPTTGVNSLAWFVPIAALIFGPLMIWLLVARRRSDDRGDAVRSTESIVAEMQERLKQLREKRGAV